MSDLQTKNILTGYSSKSIVDLVNKTPHAALSEKFLASSHEKTKWLLKAIGDYEARKRRLLACASFFPVLFLISFAIPPQFGDFLMATENITRVSTGFLIGLSLFASLALSWVNEIRWYHFLVIPLPIAYTYNAADDFFLIVLGEAGKRNIFLTVSTFLAFAPLLYLYTLIVEYIKGHAPITAQVEKDLQMLLEEALATSQQAKIQELASLIKDYAPEYSGMLKNLKIENADLNLDIPKVDTPPPIPPQNFHLPIYMGVTQEGRHETIDLATLPHLLVGGATGKGKSNFLNHVICGFLKKEDIKLILIDPEQVEFASYENAPNVTYVGRLKAANEMLELVIQEMDTRQRLLLVAGVKKIEEYNDNKSNSKLARQVIVIDEFASFMSEKGFQKKLIHIARIGRKYGVHLIVATQRPDKDVISMQVRANLPASVAFGVRDKANATILSAPGAENLNKPGLAYLVMGNQQLLVQTPLAKKYQTEIQAGGPTAPTVPKTQASGPSVPDVPETQASGPSVLDVPKAQAGGATAPDVPQTQASGPSVPDVPNAQAGGATAPDVPQTQASGPSVPDVPNAQAGGPTTVPVQSLGSWVLKPARRGDQKAFFIRSQDFRRYTKNPEQKGFKEVRHLTSDGARIRGYWVMKLN